MKPDTPLTKMFAIERAESLLRREIDEAREAGDGVDNLLETVRLIRKIARLTGLPEDGTPQRIEREITRLKKEQLR